MRCSSTSPLLLLLLLAQACDSNPVSPRDTAAPALATSAAASAFTQVAAGANHTCALTSDHRAWCWGWASERKHLSPKDVAAVGGWVDTTTLQKCYQVADDDETMEAVVLQPRRLRQVAG